VSGQELPTLGVEEEYLLLDADAVPIPIASRVLRAVRRETRRTSWQPQQELVAAQLEVATSRWTDIGQLREEIIAARAALATAAHAVGAVLAPIGAAPLEPRRPMPVTDETRYRLIEASAPGLVREQLVNSMHVHVAVPNRDAGVAAMNRMRPWLHVLLALSANSPFWGGRDTGFASWRSVQTRRWGVHGAPPALRGAAEHDRRADALIRAGAVVDRPQLPWSLRLSERLPAVEVRVADVQLDVDSMVMMAVLTRALVMAGLRAASSGAPEPVVLPELLDAAAWQAARDGVAGDLIDPLPGRLGRRPGAAPQPRSAIEVVEHLLDYLSPVAGAAGVGDVLATLAAILLGAGGAARLRRAVRRGGVSAMLDLCRVHTVAAGRVPLSAAAG